MKELAEIPHCKGVAVAMGGGLPFGVVSLGLLRLLEEKQVPVRALAGCSMGAIVSAIYSRNPNAFDVAGLLADFFDTLSPARLMIRDLGLFKPGLLRGKAIMDKVEELLGGDFMLEDSEIPLVINATDLLRGTAVFIKEGSALDAIRASISMPGIFTPWSYKDTYLVDGGITCPVPAQALEGMGCPIIPVRALRKLPDEDEVAREKEHFDGEHELQFGKAPAIIYVLWRALGLIQQDDYSRQIMDDYPQAVAPKISMELSGNLEKTRELVELGYDEANRVWPEISASILAAQNS
jgi:NTE family protein